MLTVVMHNHIRLTESDDRIIDLMKTLGEYPSKAQVVHELLRCVRSLEGLYIILGAEAERNSPMRVIAPNLCDTIMQVQALNEKIFESMKQAEKFVKETSK